MKKTIREHHVISWHEGTLDEIAFNIQQTKDKYPDATRLSLDEHWYGYESMEMTLTVERLETDEEELKREKIELARVKREGEELLQRQQANIQRDKDKIGEVEETLRKMKEKLHKKETSN